MASPGRRRAGWLPIVAALAATAFGASLAAPASSDAATVAIGVRDAIAFAAAPGEANRVTLTPVDGDAVLVRDAGAPLLAGAGCTQQGPAVRCPFSAEVLVSLEDRDDVFDASQLGTANVAAGGGPGNDRLEGDGGTGIDDALYGGPGTDVLAGGDGEDYLFGGAGRDRVLGGAGGDFGYGGDDPDRLLGESGADTLSPGKGDDLVRGGPGGDSLVEISAGSGADRMLGEGGRDRAVYYCRACRVSLDRRANDGPPGGADDVRAEDAFTPGAYFDQEAEEFVGFAPGEDRVIGDGGANRLRTGIGDDVVAGAGGEDEITAGRGRDRVVAGDGEADEVDCGPGEDRVTADPIDRFTGCETVVTVQP